MNIKYGHCYTVNGEIVVVPARSKYEQYTIDLSKPIKEMDLFKLSEYQKVQLCDLQLLDVVEDTEGEHFVVTNKTDSTIRLISLYTGFFNDVDISNPIENFSDIMLVARFEDPEVKFKKVEGQIFTDKFGNKMRVCQFNYGYYPVNIKVVEGEVRIDICLWLKPGYRRPISLQFDQSTITNKNHPELRCVTFAKDISPELEEIKPYWDACIISNFEYLKDRSYNHQLHA